MEVEVMVIDMYFSERHIERCFKKALEAKGALVWKFVSPGIVGVPDRIVLLPGGRAVFAELKRPGEKLRPIQAKRAAELTALGY